MLEEGADVNCFEEVVNWVGGRSALHIAAEYGHLAVAKELIAGGANVNLMDRDPSYKSSPLSTASFHNSLEVAKALLAAGADIHQLDSSGWTCLHTTVSANYEIFTEMLLKAGANPNARNSMGNTPMDRAEMTKDRAAIAGLLRRYGGVLSR